MDSSIERGAFVFFRGVRLKESVSDLSSRGGHQQETRASAQPGGHLPDYAH